MDRNQGNQGGQGGQSHGLGNMDQDKLHRGQQKGGETSSHEQDRDNQGKFTGNPSGSGSIRGGLGDTRSGGQGQGGSQSGGQGSGHAGGQGSSNR